MTQPSVRFTTLHVHSVAGHLGLAGMTSLGLALAYPEPGWGQLAHVALVPTGWLAIHSDSVKRLFWTTYLAALVWWLVRISWLSNVTLGGYVTLSAYLALYMPTTWVLLRWLHSRYQRVHGHFRGFRGNRGNRGWGVTIWLPMVWVSLELVRGRFLAGGFGWFALGHSQAPYTPDGDTSRLIQIADLFGEHSVSFLVAMTNGFLIDWLINRSSHHAPQSARGGLFGPWCVSPTRRAGLVWLTAMLASWGYGQYRIHQTAPYHGAQLDVAVVQTNVPQDNKNHPTARQQAHDWQRMIQLTRQAAQPSPPP